VNEPIMPNRYKSFDFVIYYYECINHLTQLSNLIDIIDYHNEKKIRQREYFVEYLICQAGGNLVL